MAKQFRITLETAAGTRETRFLNCGNIESAKFIADAIYGQRFTVVGVSES